MRLLPSASLASLVLTACSAFAHLDVREDREQGRLTVWREGATEPLIVQSARPDHRPYLHPLAAPDGRGVLTEFSPGHHRHQTGVYWGITRLNGRDYFHNPGADHWRRVALTVDRDHGDTVAWTAVYDLLGADGQPVWRETQRWAARDGGDTYTLDLEWTGEALTDVTISEYAYGGLFVRMPWRPGIEGYAINSTRQRNERANGQRTTWVDVGLRLDGRDDLAHLAVFDHPANPGYPLPWRVDGQLGFGPSPATLGDRTLTRGQSETYRHRLFAYTGPHDDVKVDAAWRAYTGERSDSVLWRLAQEESRKAVFLTGEQAVQKMTVPAGMEVTLFAGEPDITQPMAFCWDDRGRLWVAENRDYESRGAGFSNSGDSRIVILEDTDGDGKMDTRKVFLDGIPFPAAIAVGFDGLWLGAPPNLLFVPDRNRDDRADADIEVRLTGWGIQDRHETLNSLMWGPDGWLYGCQGFATRSEVGKPADGGRIYRAGEPFPAKLAVIDPQYIDGGVWRYHPVKDRFEVVAHGFSNPWGLDFDDHGQMFITACVIPHLWHVIPGGIYHRQGGRHINPHVYDDIKTIADHRHRSAHGGARIYLADAFPAKYRNTILMANIHEHALLADVLEPSGSGYIGRHGEDVLLANDPQWVGFSVEIGPDGAVYILDWHDADICGKVVANKDTGRIFRLAPQGLRSPTGFDLAALSDLELARMQTHRNDWYVRRARVLLQHRATRGPIAPEAVAHLEALLRDPAAAPVRLRALWALHVTGNLSPDRLRGLLADAAPHVRGWAVQLLCEDGSPGADTVATFTRLAQADPSPVVRLALTAALQRLPHDQRWDLAAALLARGEDANDHNLPKMLWFAVEPLVAGDAARALALTHTSQIPLVNRFLVRRAAAEKSFAAIARQLTAAPVAVRTDLLTGLRDGLASLGRNELATPPGWDAVATSLAAEGDETARALLVEIGRLFGDAQAAAAAFARLTDPATPAAERRTLLRGLAADGYAPVLPVALAWLDDAEMRRDALRALVSFDSAAIAPAILTPFTTWPAADRSEAVLTLAARRTTATPLLEALRDGRVPKREVSAFAARQLQRVLGPAFVDWWGPVTQPDDARQQEIARWKQALTPAVLAGADLRQGRAMFERTCAACHQLYDQGGKIGPDLTGSNRTQLDYLLSEIINPSEVIQDAYRLVTVTTRDGRTLAGNVAAEDDRQLTLRLIGEDTRIEKADILSRDTSSASMMPEGLLQTLSPDEVRDLIAYLQTAAPTP